MIMIIANPFIEIHLFLRRENLLEVFFIKKKSNNPLKNMGIGKKKRNINNCRKVAKVAKVAKVGRGKAHDKVKRKKLRAKRKKQLEKLQVYNSKRGIPIRYEENMNKHEGYNFVMDNRLDVQTAGNLSKKRKLILRNRRHDQKSNKNEHQSSITNSTVTDTGDRRNIPNQHEICNNPGRLK